ncbi:hypothetical protein GWK47_002608 [Chionoecetes opilio]|uniref:Uncharacterized protein n=1 Tax=Chionoecetes opilio TaxID=41210 RepID=A0A8J4XLL8_CHIOP|nr:hypothetical protein GWK47_002608 [Chionoecetes opilio]
MRRPSACWQCPLGWRRTLRGPPMFPSSLCEESTKDHRSRSCLKIPMSGPEEEPRLASKTSLRSPRGHDGGQANQSKLHPSSCSIRMQAPCTMPVFEAVVSNRKAMILSLTPASSTSFKTTAATFFWARRIRACRDPQEGTRRHLFPCEEDGDAVPPYRQRGTGGFSVPKQDQPLRYLLVFPSSTIFSAACPSPPQFVGRWTVLFETAILPMSIPKNLSGSCER